LNKVSFNRNVFFGNHLFNHDVPAQLSDADFLRSFNTNQEELRKYPNYRNVFSFPFGQPGTCFSGRHVTLVSQSGAKKVFCSAGNLNHDLGAECLDRVSLSSAHDSSLKIWGQIFFRSFLNRLSLKFNNGHIPVSAEKESSACR
jgi:hypothetical protein